MLKIIHFSTFSTVAVAENVVFPADELVLSLVLSSTAPQFSRNVVLTVIIVSCFLRPVMNVSDTCNAQPTSSLNHLFAP